MAVGVSGALRNQVCIWVHLFDILVQLAARQMLSQVQTFFLLFSSLLALGQEGPAPPQTSSGSTASSPVIVVGFLGGFVRHDNLIHSPVQLAARLREDYPSGVYVEAFENRRRKKARAKILQLLDTDHDGTLSLEEKQRARIVIYGISWGASASVTLARELQRDGIPVLLTIQVDSISKIRQNDAFIPANVAEAANFYQPDGLLHGRSEIHAADAKHTRIIGNFKFDYRAHPLSCAKYPWFERYFAKSHTEIECDPIVWSQVESLIRSKLPTAEPRDAARSSSQ